MAHLLHLDASARGASLSRELGRTFAHHWQSAHPDGTYIHRDLAKHPISPIHEARTELSMLSSLHGVKNLAAMDEVADVPHLAQAWALTRPLIEELIECDVLLIGTPMYNFSIPGALKTWIDRVSLPWLPLAEKSVVIVSARGGAYGPGSPRSLLDFQEPYLRAYFTALGVEDLEFVHAELTHAPVLPFLAQFRDTHEESRAAALKAVKALASRASADTTAALRSSTRA